MPGAVFGVRVAPKPGQCKREGGRRFFSILPKSPWKQQQTAVMIDAGPKAEVIF